MIIVCHEEKGVAHQREAVYEPVVLGAGETAAAWSAIKEKAGALKGG
jgi:hypothetical protein